MDKQPLEAVPKKNNNRKKKQKKDPIKVVYISNPLKVTLTVSEFKERVQELTGQDSDIADYMLKKKVVVASQPEEEHDNEEEEEEATALPSMPMASVASTDIQYLSTISTASIPGASTDLRKNDSFPFDAPFYDMSFTDLCYEESSQLLLDGW